MRYMLKDTALLFPGKPADLASKLNWGGSRNNYQILTGHQTLSACTR